MQPPSPRLRRGNNAFFANSAPFSAIHSKLLSMNNLHSYANLPVLSNPQSAIRNPQSAIP
jgi:hypothetical protein